MTPAIRASCPTVYVSGVGSGAGGTPVALGLFMSLTSQGIVDPDAAERSSTTSIRFQTRALLRQQRTTDVSYDEVAL